MKTGKTLRTIAALAAISTLALTMAACGEAMPQEPASPPPPPLLGTLDILLEGQPVAGRTVGTWGLLTIDYSVLLPNHGDVTIRWYRAETRDGERVSAGPNGASRQVTPADEGRILIAVASRAGSVGSAEAFVLVPHSWAQPLAAPINPIEIVPDEPLDIAGPLGRLLAVNPAALGGSGEIFFQWFRSLGSAAGASDSFAVPASDGPEMLIPGATGATRVVTYDDTGFHLFVRMTRLGNSGFVDSAPIFVPRGWPGMSMPGGRADVLVTDRSGWDTVARSQEDWSADSRPWENDGWRWIYAHFDSWWNSDAAGDVRITNISGNLNWGLIPAPRFDQLHDIRGLGPFDRFDSGISNPSARAASVSEFTLVNPDARAVPMLNVEILATETLRRGNATVRATATGWESTSHTVHFVFVSDPVVVSIRAESGGQSFVAGRTINVNRNAATLSLQRGWNTVTLTEEFVGTPDGPITVTESLAVGAPDGMRWMMFVYTQEVLVPPTDLRIDRAELTWQSPGDAVEYGIYLNGIRVAFAQNRLFDIRSLVFSPWVEFDRESGETYELRVRAFAPGWSPGDSALSAPVSFVPRTDFPRPAAPHGLSVGGATLSWQSAGDASSYRIYVDGIFQRTTWGRSFDLNDLISQSGPIRPDSDATYELRVRAQGGTGYFDSLLSEPVDFAIPLAVPHGLSVDGATLSWQSLGDALNYRIYVGGVGTAFQTNQRQFDIGQLISRSGPILPGSVAEYELRVRALGDVASSALSAPVDFSIPLDLSLAWLRANASDGGSYDVVLSTWIQHSITPAEAALPQRNNLTITIRRTAEFGGTMRPSISLSQSEWGSMFSVGSGVTLVLENVTLRGRATNNSPLVRVNGGGTLIMNSGAVRDNRNNVSAWPPTSGGGVMVDSGGSFIMNGGWIDNNSHTISGGGVFVASGATFEMRGGNIGSNFSGDSGGGVTVLGTFTMRYGNISNNTANANFGGGVRVGSSGVFVMHDSFIHSNTTGVNGGGVSSSGTFTMHDGGIDHNETTGFLGSGGGVWVDAGSVFNMRGGTIVGNRATGTGVNSGGGGVHVATAVGMSPGAFNISDGRIQNNFGSSANTNLLAQGQNSARTGTFNPWGVFFPTGNLHSGSVPIEIANGVAWLGGPVSGTVVATGNPWPGQTLTADYSGLLGSGFVNVEWQRSGNSGSTWHTVHEGGSWDPHFRLDSLLISQGDWIRVRATMSANTGSAYSEPVVITAAP